MLSSVDQRPDLMEYYAVKFAVDLLQGKEVPNRYMVPLANVMKDTLE